MLGKNFKYKWIDFTDSVQLSNRDTLGYSIIIRDKTNTSDIRYNTTNKSNFHWVYLSPSLLWWRRFEFECSIIADTCEAKDSAYNYIFWILQPDYNPYSLNRGFYDLEWEDCTWLTKTTKAKVTQMPQPEGEQCTPTMDFTFVLESETPDIYSTTEKTATGTIGFHWWFTLSTPLPTPLSWWAGTIELNNEWNRNAPIQVRVEGNCINPKIINITNNQAYKLDTTTTDLVYNNRNINNRPTETLVVTDLWNDIRQFRKSWIGVTLDPWLNNLVVLTDNYPNDAIVTVSFRDTYIN